MKKHIIKTVKKESIAEELGIESGDRLLTVNGQEIEDIFDFQYLTEDEYIEVLIEKQDGEEWLLEVDKDEDEDLGIIFENGLMDEYRSCRNKCIFCFIDQMPKGMRDTLYFKDDDSRLSFLQGNYVTLTNMSDHDIERIIHYHLSPINVSFQTTNPELRCKMLNNRFAGDALKKVDRLYEAGITMNGQIVLCKGVNDGCELERSIHDLAAYIPVLESVSVVPVGLSRYRDGLFPLTPFTRVDAEEILHIIHQWQKKLYHEHGTHFIHASDELYILAGQEMPPEENYDGYLQLENGVGMVRLLLQEYTDAIREERLHPKKIASEEVSMVTGMLMNGYIKTMTKQLQQIYPQLTIRLYPVVNHFFGENITVSGLLTGQDIIEQLQDKPLGDRLLLPCNLLRSGEEVLLDDVTVTDIEKALQVKVDIVKSSGWDFIKAITGISEG
ncbi:MAG: DUF512 domain-containing protein [bacterium]|nr:DUF512 domain-containing protein [bacterium]